MATMVAKFGHCEKQTFRILSQFIQDLEEENTEARTGIWIIEMKCWREEERCEIKLHMVDLWGS